MLKNWCYWTVVLEKSLESPLDCKEIKPVHPKKKSVLNIHWKDRCWCWNSQDFGHLMWRSDLLEKTLMLGKIEGRRRRGQQRMQYWMASPTQWTWVWASSGSWWWTGKPGVLQFMGSQRVRHDWATELKWLTWEDDHHSSTRESLQDNPWCLSAEGAKLSLAGYIRFFKETAPVDYISIYKKYIGV